jgi:hypothetical protein
MYGDDGFDYLCGWDELDVAFGGGVDYCDAYIEYSCDTPDPGCVDLCDY